MSNHPVAPGEEEHHLGVPVVRRQRPSMTEDDGLPCAPVLVEDLHSILRGDCAHGVAPLVVLAASSRGQRRPAGPSASTGGTDIRHRQTLRLPRGELAWRNPSPGQSARGPVNRGYFVAAVGCRDRSRTRLANRPTARATIPAPTADQKTAKDTIAPLMLDLPRVLQRGLSQTRMAS